MGGSWPQFGNRCSSMIARTFITMFFLTIFAICQWSPPFFMPLPRSINQDRIGSQESIHMGYGQHRNMQDTTICTHQRAAAKSLFTILSCSRWINGLMEQRKLLVFLDTMLLHISWVGWDCMRPSSYRIGTRALQAHSHSGRSWVPILSGSNSCSKGSFQIGFIVQNCHILFTL